MIRNGFFARIRARGCELFVARIPVCEPMTFSTGNDAA